MAEMLQVLPGDFLYEISWFQLGGSKADSS